MPKKIKRKGTSRRSKRQDNPVFYDEIADIDDFGEVRFYLDGETIRKIRDMSESIQVTRMLDENPSAGDRVAQYYITKGATPAQATNMARIYYAKHIESVTPTVVMVAVIDDIFEVGDDNEVFVREPYPDIVVPDDYFDDEVDVEAKKLQRLTGLPDRSPRMKWNPVEQKVGLLEQIFKEYPDFEAKFAEYLIPALQALQDYEPGEEVEEVDESGFQPKIVDGTVHKEAVSNSKSRESGRDSTVRKTDGPV